MVRETPRCLLSSGRPSRDRIDFSSTLTSLNNENVLITPEALSFEFVVYSLSPKGKLPAD
jgi:hypothetical protein